ncbi:MAG TPA: 3-hydroxyacyl-CoA dehydrogenase NAD-binding domain-containing protein [Aestuariivirgaceae bacterium]|nr:3-hydroxyacyl-CoA dehydrogenase NAD-binding domain-containing protein [Aestuariivirgaceae bacterium]
MSAPNFRTETSSDGILIVTWDMPGRSMNVIDEAVIGELEGLVERVKTDAAIRAVVITSGKPAFCAGADLAMIEAAFRRYGQSCKSEGEEAATRALQQEAARLSQALRALETCGKPVAAAINGTALGGGFELCLACHYRVAVEDGDARLGLPESRLGLLPGAGGTQRLPRLIGAKEALPLMLQGRQIGPAEALKLGAVDRIVPADRLLDEARNWLLNNAKSSQPWDETTFRLPGGAVYSGPGLQLWSAANALYRKETFDNYDAQRAIMKCVYEGLTAKTIDAGLAVEQRYLTMLLRGPQAANMIRTLFFSMQALGKGARRPSSEPETRVKRLGLLGAGFMGAGIAYVSARAGIEIVLIDRDRDSAERGKAHAGALMDREIDKGRASAADKQAVLDRIATAVDYDRLTGCDLLIEGVFEDRELKAEVLPRAEHQLGSGAILASNTSTLPITGLASYLERPQQFIGIHFFSPVEKMQLVEIILGRQTGEAALAKALDYVRQIRKVPIVVNDSRGFFTSRVVMTYIAEGHYMLEEGVPAALIENAGRMAGMPVGPLALNDEVALDLSWKILQATKKDLGESYEPRPIDRILEEMVVNRGRHGRKNATGFYDYPQDRRKSLWPGIAAVAPPRANGFDVEQLKERLILIQALETARCFEEGVLTDVREADVGALLGFGFAPFSGGPLSYIDTLGPAAVVVRCHAYAGALGPRYRPCSLVLDMAKAGEGFYRRFPAAAA